MNKQKIGLIAITIITASLISAPYSTEARTVSDTLTALAERHRLSVEVPTNGGYKVITRDSSNLSVTNRRTGEDKTPNPSATTPPAPVTVPASGTKQVPVSAPATTNPIVKVEAKVPTNSQTTQPVTTQPKNETAPVVASTESVKSNSVSVPADEFMLVLASEIHRLTNVERARAGVATLGQDTALAAIAKRHSEDMAQNNYFSHTALNGCTLTCRITGAGYRAQAWGENIAWRSSSTLPAAKELAAYFMTQWMNSAGHRQNILSGNFTREGVGLARIGNKVYATVNFAKPQ